MANAQLPTNFASFFRRLNPSSSFEAQASREYNSIKHLVESRTGPAAELAPVCFLQGSYRQSTAIYTINDVDIVALCRLWQPGRGVGGGYDRDRIFHIVAAPLRADGRYASKLHFHSGSMCIKVDLGIKVEILPVVFAAGTHDPAAEPFRLWRPERHAWEDGFARAHQRWLGWKNATQQTNGNFIPMVKTLKHLRSRYGSDAVSFHLECLLYACPDHVFTGSPADYIPAVLAWVARQSADEWYSAGCLTPCRDRNIFTANEWSRDSWSEFHRLICACAGAAYHAATATTDAAAVEWWQGLLGDTFFPRNPQ